MTLDSVNWTQEAIQDLGPTTTVPIAASVIGVSTTTVYRLIRRDEWDHTRVLHLGRVIKIPTSDLIRLLYGDVSAHAS